MKHYRFPYSERFVVFLTLLCLLNAIPALAAETDTLSSASSVSSRRFFASLRVPSRATRRVSGLLLVTPDLTNSDGWRMLLKGT